MGVVRKSNRSISAERRQFLIVMGYDPEDVIVWRLKWQRLRYHSERCGKQCKLSFEEYMVLAFSAGIKLPGEIGNTRDKYVMARYGDVGGYEVGNCRFLRQSSNYKEWIENGGKQRSDDSLRGRSKEHYPGLLSQSKKVSKVYQVTSPEGLVYCGKNLTDFCKEHKLNRGNMSSVCRGEMRSYRGWTGKYVEKLEEVV